MANNKTEDQEFMAIFGAKIQCPSGEQPALVIVYIPQGKYAWAHMVVSHDKAMKQFYIHNIAPVTMLQNLTNNVLLKLFPKAKLVNDPSYTCLSKDVTLISKIDESLRRDHSWIRCAALSDISSIGSTNTLENYISNNFNVDAAVLQRKVRALSTTPIAYPRANIDYDITWNSPYLTDDEKAILKHNLDAEIAMSNANRIAMQIVYKDLTTQYYDEKGIATAMHGNPGGGKTKGIINMCAMYNIPLIVLSGCPTMTMADVYGRPMPQNMGQMLKTSDIEPSINAVKEDIKKLQDLINQEEKILTTNPGDQSVQSQLMSHKTQLADSLKVLSDLHTLSTQKADLVKIESILLKCLKHNLPVVCLFDEFILTSTQFQNSLAPLLSDGIYQDGAIVGRNNFTVKWIFAWNPNTTGVKSFDQKFFDRVHFVHVEDLPREALTKYKTNKTLVGMNQAQGISNDYTIPDQLIATSLQDHPEFKHELDVISEILHHASGSDEAFKWFVETRLQELIHPHDLTIKPSQFNRVYLDNVVTGSAQDTIKAMQNIDELVVKINQELYTATHGCDTKNPDRNSYFYISDRVMEHFIDSIMCFHSVKDATERFILDLLPGGHTIRGEGGISATSSYKDDVPQNIVSNITTHIESDLLTLNADLFINITNSEIVEGEKAVKNSIYDGKVWANPNASNVGTPTNTNPGAANPGSSNAWSEADRMLG